MLLSASKTMPCFRIIEVYISCVPNRQLGNRIARRIRIFLWKAAVNWTKENRKNRRWQKVVLAEKFAQEVTQAFRHLMGLT